jgi:predicted permease
MSSPERQSWIVRAALRAFPRRFRADMGFDLLAAYADLGVAAPAPSAFMMARDLVRNGLGVRLDDVRRRWGGGAPATPPGGREPRGVSSLFGDFVFGLRVLRKSPVFTMVAVGSLAIGIGANTAVFTVLDATILRLLPVQAPEELVVLHMAAPSYGEYPDISQSGWMLTNDDGHAESSSFSYPLVERLRDADTPFAGVTAFAELYRINIRVDGKTEPAHGQVVEGNYYNLLGIRPVAGRLLIESDDDAAATPVVVISYAFWQTRFGGLDSAVGTEVLLNGAPFIVVGVTPPGFDGALQLGSAPPVTVPMAHQAQVMRGRELLDRVDYWWLHVLGRLEPGATMAQAESAAALTFQQSLEADLDITESSVYIKALPGSRGMTEARSEIVRPLMTVAAVVAAVLLIACVNLANLLLARAGTRAREIAVRLSLGASRARVARQLLSESLMLSLIGAGLGSLLALGLRDLLLPILDLQGTSLGLALNGRVLGFTILIAVLTGLVFGIVPALRATRVDLTPALKDEPLRSARSRFGLARGLLVLQVALSLGLLVVAGLFSGSLAHLAGEATGFDGDRVLAVTVDPRLSGYSGPTLTQYYDEAMARLRRLPGTTDVGIATHVPVSGTMSSTSVRVEGHAPAEGDTVRTFLNIVDDGFFSTFDIGATQGRVFQELDGAGSAPVAVVNQKFVDDYLPGVNPLGRQVTFGSDEPRDFEIVGVVENVKYQNLTDDSWAAVHLLYRQLPELGGFTFAVRAENQSDLAARVQGTLRDLDPDVSIERMATHHELQRQNVAVQRTFAQLSGGLSAVALLLSCIGLYGILSYSVSQRTREIGVRMALGARASDVIGLVMREMATVSIGAGLGLLGSYFAVRGLESQLYGLEATDPATMAGAAAVLLLVAAAAAFLPARQAATLDPVEALRNE